MKINIIGKFEKKVLDINSDKLPLSIGFPVIPNKKTNEIIGYVYFVCIDKGNINNYPMYEIDYFQ